MPEKETFYDILGVQENASSDDIKKAYRQLSLKYHPDRTKGDVEKNKVFQRINEAYETLGDQDKREEYDMSKKNPFMRMDSMGGMDDILSHIFRMNMGGMNMGGMNMGGMNMGGMNMGGMNMEGGMPGMFFQPGANIHVFRNGVPVNINQMSKPQPISKQLIITMENVLTGGKFPLEIERWIMENGLKVHENTTVYVDVFKGIDHNEIIVIPDQGNVVNENCKGDIKVFVHVNNETEFSRRGLDLIMNKEISLREALCGFSFDIKYINKKVYTINNQPGNIIPPNYQKVIPNMGLTRENHTGNLIIHFQTKFPDTLGLDKIEELNRILA
jgi:DnaJ-class molecular chaperone